LLYVSISDPNTIPAGYAMGDNVFFPPISANCIVRWNPYAEEPFGCVTPCPDSSFTTGRWTVEMQKQNARGYGPSPTRDFKLLFCWRRV
jgi:hypothetical protein